jgi:hypothetical protein
VEGAVTIKLQDDHSMLDEASRFFSEIESRQFAFRRAETEAAAMRATPRPALARWAREVLLGPGARRLSVHVLKGGNRTEDAPAIPGLRLVGEGGPEALKATLEAIPDPMQPWPQVVTPSA